MPELDYAEIHQAAVAAYSAASDTVQKTREALMAAESAIARTSPAMILAAGGDLMAGSADHSAAIARRDYVKAALAAAEKHCEDKLAAQIVAERETRRPAFNLALARRIAACRAADEARAALEAADREFRSATAQMEATHARGLPRYFDGAMLQGPVKTEAKERALWDHHVK